MNDDRLVSIVVAFMFGVVFGVLAMQYLSPLCNA